MASRWRATCCSSNIQAAHRRLRKPGARQADRLDRSAPRGSARWHRDPGGLNTSHQLWLLRAGRARSIWTEDLASTLRVYLGFAKDDLTALGRSPGPALYPERHQDTDSALLARCRNLPRRRLK
jgi:hypothetical protein